MDLKEIFQNVNEWLRFSEAKNAAVLVLSSVFVPAIMAATEGATEAFQLYAWVSCTFLMISLFLSLVSFFPRLGFVGAIRPQTPPKENPNLVFFGDIATLPMDAYIAAIGESGIGDAKSGIRRHVAEQIHINSIITSRKLRIFNWSLRLFLAGIFTPFVFLVLLILLKNRDI